MYLTLKEIRHDKWKFTALGLIIFLIVFLVLFITGLANGLANDSGSAIKETPAKTFILQKGSQARLNRSNLSTKDWQKFQDKYHNAATKLSIAQMTIQRKNNASKKTDIAYFITNQNSFLTPKAVKKTTGNEVYVSKKLETDGYKVGDSFKDSNSNKTFKIAGFTNNESYSHSPVIYLNNRQATDILPDSNSFNTIALKKGLSKKSGYQVITNQTLIDNIPGYSAEQSSLYLMIGFLYLISLFVLAVFFYIINLQKISDFGTLKALGTKTSYLVGHVLTEMGLLSLGGILASFLVTYLIKLKMPASMPFSLNLTTLLGTGVLFLVIALISALLSLIKVVKVDPINAIGGNN
ncbi:ABC transporter permease [Companilactobacillus alimentarius]|uniref:Putative hemin transport system permease protein HrtB n=1 Tax=Companilactobacillus alimentarius DSM 20249 TaxID=1423720 RepID=A0A2K9HJL5_9LACO|nr:ABC transporter permease [Companilactobacillus alimentarius]AUI71897.1 permease [Companilactobacillus alimentarius DSM 20249]KRK76831.1 hypothetical protein FC67_GL000380 [Companilactobacillus alimentarius DSM 20249]GEO45099.1 ABC transporter permease [Companilactobacillus alimentarius]